MAQLETKTHKGHHNHGVMKKTSIYLGGKSTTGNKQKGVEDPIQKEQKEKKWTTGKSSIQTKITKPNTQKLCWGKNNSREKI